MPGIHEAFENGPFLSYNLTGVIQEDRCEISIKAQAKVGFFLCRRSRKGGNGRIPFHFPDENVLAGEFFRGQPRQARIRFSSPSPGFRRFEAADHVNFLLEFDRFLFFLGNTIWHVPALDWFMPIITDFSRWAPLLGMVFVWLLFGAGGKHRVLALALLIGVGSADIVSSRFIKKTVARRRPCCTEITARKLIGCKSSKSFPSSHAANTAAAAAVIITMRGWWIGAPFAILAGMVGYSRLYVGVHFPLDILGGFLLGAMIGSLVGSFIHRRRPLTQRLRHPSPEPRIHPVD
jgi:undecaprenyl-diphosphatase